MARIRTIKPEFWTSEQIVECSTSARLLFVGMWNFCDDAGRHAASYARLKMEIFPADPFTTDEIRGMVDELIAAGLVVYYEAQGVSVWQVTGWHHQKIDRPNPSKFPEPSTPIRRLLDEQSSSAQRTIVEHSPPEGKGREGKGKVREGESAIADSPPSPQAAAGSGERFACVGGEWELPAAKLDAYREAFPGVDLTAEFRKVRIWLDDHPPKRPRAGRGAQQFLSRWLCKAHEAARRIASTGDAGQKTKLIGPPSPEVKARLDAARGRNGDHQR